MIGVLCKEEEKEIAQEFFELFKTPWEFFGEGRHYDVVISTLREIPALNTALFILYSSEPTQFDGLERIAINHVVSPSYIYHDGMGLPIYGDLVIFCCQGQPLLYNQSSSEAVAVKFTGPQGHNLRVGYDLFHEAAFLLSEGQPVENALTPTLELHISMLRDWILNAGIPLVEIPPVPWGYRFISCLTHDVDFAGIRLHKLDHTMWGFVNRALVGSFLGFLKGTRSLVQMMKNWTAVFSLPLVYIGIAKDFWDDFERYAEIEEGLSSTFFFIPFKNRPGKMVKGDRSAWRATRYDISDIKVQIKKLIKRGSEIGLHGIDAWHNAEKGRQEIERIIEVTGRREIGVRMHWLCFDHHSPSILEQAGFDYDSTVGYNETIGYKAGTAQVYRFLGVTRLLELPLHIQDTALFYPNRLALTRAQAWDMCGSIINAAIRFGGVTTVLWHQRSLAPERLWDKFYINLLQELKSQDTWFGTASQVVQWFRQRRSVTFEDCSYISNKVRLRLRCQGGISRPRMFLRIHKPQKAGPVRSYAEHGHFDLPYSGESLMEIALD
jgi:hypothetical protein